MISETDKCEHNIEYKLCEICQNDIEYLLLNIQEQVNGTKYRNMYYLKPDTFKLILMCSRYGKKYSKYFLLLEKSIKYYHDYQNAYIISQKEYIISQKDTILSEIRAINLEQTAKIDEQTAKIDELLGYAKDAKEDLNSLLDITIDCKLKCL